ncbi:viral late transcription factor 2 [Equine molluscum contagiosum-like virus]|nr:viral late transcription factor 2 [Equine molluscum contagiosum-like virus]
MAAPRRFSLQGITISEPKAVLKPLRQEAISCVLPEYYHTVAKLRLRVSAEARRCWFCAQPVQTRFAVETLHGRAVGSFCSRICSDSFAGTVKAHVALREEPKVTLLPLVFYQEPEEVLRVINALRHRDGVYGSCFFDERDASVTLTLRSLL